MPALQPSFFTPNPHIHHKQAAGLNFNPKPKLLRE